MGRPQYQLRALCQMLEFCCLSGDLAGACSSVALAPIPPWGGSGASVNQGCLMHATDKLDLLWQPHLRAAGLDCSSTWYCTHSRCCLVC